jgi:hypothetical protein
MCIECRIGETFRILTVTVSPLLTRRGCWGRLITDAPDVRKHLTAKSDVDHAIWPIPPNDGFRRHEIGIAQ